MHVAPGRRVSEENIELVEAAFDAWNRGESEAFAGHLAEDVAWLEVSGRPEGGSSDLFGRDWESYHLEVERMHDLGDRVVAVVWEVALTGEGVEVDGRWGYVRRVGHRRLSFGTS